MQLPQSPCDDLQALTAELDTTLWLRPGPDVQASPERGDGRLEVWLAVLGSLLGVGGYLLLA